MDNRPPLLDAVRAAAEAFRVCNIGTGDWMPLQNERGEVLNGIRARVGVVGIAKNSDDIGIDLIEMDPGAGFDLHAHEGDHILFMLSGEALVHVDGVDHHVHQFDSIFIAAEFPHGVRTVPGDIALVRFLAVGIPHKHVSSIDRMRLI